MSEQNWLGNSDVPTRNIVIDPLTDERFLWTTFYLHGGVPHNHADEARCGPDCPSTPIYADVYSELPLPNPWTDWPMSEVYLEMSRNHEPYYVQRFIFGGFPPPIPLQDKVSDPRWQVSEGSWTLPDYSYGQENPDQ